jgi:hypothetical protein
MPHVTRPNTHGGAEVSDAAWEAIQKEAARMREREERDRVCCRNCVWFGQPSEGETLGRCMRYPPTEYDADLTPLVPRVLGTWVCGEFMSARTGETFQGDSMARVNGKLRARVAELEDRIDRMSRSMEGEQ